MWRGRIRFLLLGLAVGVLPHLGEAKGAREHPDGQEGSRAAGPVEKVDAGDSSAVNYEADRVEYDFESGEMVLVGHVRLRHGEVDLSAGLIRFFRKEGILRAEGVPDSTGKPAGLPVFRRDKEEIRGTHMVYDLRAGRGEVIEGRTSFERKFLQGDTIRTTKGRTVRIRGGSLTTCSLDRPHSDFYCRSLIITPEDKAIATSVLFRVEGVPIAWIPIFVFPLRKGRHSGILTPSIGSNERDGLFVNNLGYYFGSSDYWDATASLGVRDRGGLLVQSRARYALRDRYNGSLEAMFESRRTSGRSTGRGWRVEAEHYQRIGRTAALRGSGSLLSSVDFNLQNSTQLYRILSRSVRSNLSYDRRWEGSDNNLQAILLHEQDLDSGETRFLSFPSVTFRGGRRPLWKPRREDGAGGTARRWYEGVFYSFNAGLTEGFTRRNQPGKNTEELGLSGALSVSSQQQAFGWLNLTPELTVSQRLSRNDEGLPTRVEDYSALTSTGMALYGLFPVRMGRLRAIRHVIRPNLAFSFSQSAVSHGGTFGFGGDRRTGDPRQALSMSLGNTFQVKTETDGKEQRSDFATLDLVTSYSPEASGRGWSPLALSAAVKPDRRLDVRLNALADLYDDNGRFRRPHLNSLSITSILRLTGRRRDALPVEGQNDREEWRSGGILPGSTTSGFGFERDLYSDAGDTRSPWQVSLTHYHSLSRFRYLGGETSSLTSVVKLGAAFNPTGGWRIDYSLNSGLAPRRQITAQTLSIYRSLHEWEARFSWTPTGFNKGAYFKLNLKDIPQIKIERRSGAMGGF